MTNNWKYFIGSLALLLVACNKPPQFEMPEDLLELFYFKSGSYWVLENQNSGELDTIRVVNDYLGWSDNPESFCDNCLVSYHFQEAGITMTRSNAGDTLEITFDSRPEQDNIEVKINGQPVFLKGAEGTTNESNLSVTDVLDSITVDSVLYYNVIEIENTNDLWFSGSGIWTRNLYAPGVGLIQKEIAATGVKWDLIDRSLDQID